MVAAELNQRHHLVAAGGAVIGATLAAGLVAVLDPAIAGSTPPHPTLAGSLDDWLAITGANLRVLAAPTLLWLLGADKSRLGRRAGDVVVLAVIAVNAIPVGIALGHWQGRLVPYVPQLPLEWTALTLAVSAWLTIRTGTATRQRIAVLAGNTAVLIFAAAGLETWGTPHRPASVVASRKAVDLVHRRSLPCGGSGVAFATDFAPGRPGRCKVARSLPLTPVRFRSADNRRRPGYINHPRTPTRRDHHMNTVCVSWNWLQVMHVVGCGLLISSGGADRCRR
jgi:hypothetical protein